MEELIQDQKQKSLLQFQLKHNVDQVPKVTKE